MNPLMVIELQFDQHENAYLEKGFKYLWHIDLREEGFSKKINFIIHSPV